MLCDGQVHIWGADSRERPWPAVHGEPHREQPFTAAEIVHAMDQAGVDRAIIVPPSWEGDRNDLAIAAVHDHPGRFGIMGRLDLTKERETDLGRWRETPGMLGVRLTFHRPEMYPWLTDGRAEWLWRGAAQAGLPVMALAPGQNDTLASIARRYPDLQIVIDHLNLLSESRREQIGPTIAALAPLIDCANVIMKISALPCCTDERSPFTELRSHIRDVVDTFGAERCMWGSDISRLPCDYGEWASIFTPSGRLLTLDEADQIGGATLCRVLGWPEQP